MQQILLLAQHVSGTTMPIVRSSRVLYGGCCLWYFVLWTIWPYDLGRNRPLLFRSHNIGIVSCGRLRATGWLYLDSGHCRMCQTCGRTDAHGHTNVPWSLQPELLLLSLGLSLTVMTIAVICILTAIRKCRQFLKLRSLWHCYICLTFFVWWEVH